MRLYHFLCEELSLEKHEIRSYIDSAPRKYKVYTIPKRTSGKRVIAHPARPLKDIQRALVSRLEQVLPVHQSAYAYRKNISIKDNAAKHRKSKFLLKMDFLDFFHSITPRLFFSLIDRLDIKLSPEDKFLLKQVLFWCPSKRKDGAQVLSIGAPSSPLISNFVMFFFDSAVDELCREKGVVYTRYADDITFSTNKKNILFEFPKLVRSMLYEQFDGIVCVNEKKTVFTSKAHNRHVTGVTLANDGSLSIGRKRKRYISSLIHKYSINQLPQDEMIYLQGFLAYAFSIEPTFKNRMVDKYSLDIICKIIKGVE